MCRKETPAIGDIRYKVFVGRDDQPWLCTLRLGRISPQGHSFHFEATGSQEPFVIKCRSQRWPPKTREEAVHKFQMDSIAFCFGYGRKTERALRLVLAAQKLLEE
jgi:hypothetical protein